MKKFCIFFLSFFVFLEIILKTKTNVYAMDLNLGKQIFLKNCNVCHLKGTNVIIPEKNLKKETLEANGMNKIDAIIYQITNGKNGMPAFGRRLTEKQINEVANYVLQKSAKNFQE